MTDLERLRSLAVFCGDVGLRVLSQEKAVPLLNRSSGAGGGGDAAGGNFERKAVSSPSGSVREGSERLASSARSLECLRRAMEAFDECPLKRTATNLVFSDGNPEAPIMLVGEAPGRDEDLQGRPFVGRAGRLLDVMLMSVGLDRSVVYITNILPWRPPGNRTPTVEEQLLYEPFVRQHIALVRPRILVCLGSISSKRLLPIEKGQGIVKVRGRWFPFALESGEVIDALPMFHPAYLLRQPSQKALAWLDLLSLRKRVDGMGLLQRESLDSAG